MIITRIFLISVISTELVADSLILEKVFESS